MRKLLFTSIFFLLFAVPASAEGFETLDLGMTIASITNFTINNAGPLTYTYNDYADFGVANDIGDINYDIFTDAGWKVDGIILDGTQGGQTADDWSAGWTLSVNGVTINETAAVTIDSGGGPVNRDDALYEVLLTIPWSESVSTPDCTIQLTAADL